MAMNKATRGLVQDLIDTIAAEATPDVREELVNVIQAAGDRIQDDEAAPAQSSRDAVEGRGRLGS